MIKIDMDIEKNTIREVSCQGDIMTILAELSFAIGQIYHDLHTLNPTAGNAFRKMVIRCLGDPGNPMWWIHGVNQGTHLCRSIRIDEDLIRRAMGKEEQHESDNA